jgi:hypothetical protein
MHETAFDQKKQQVMCVAERAGAKIAAYMPGMSNNCCASNTRWPSLSVEPMNISATPMMASVSDAQAHEGLRHRLIR